MSSIHTSQVVGSEFHSRKLHAILGTVGLALLGASQVQAAPSANGAIHAVTGMAHANYHATINCGNNVTVMTPQPGTDLMPVEMQVDTTTSPDVEAFYDRAARQQVTWVDTAICEKTNYAGATITGNDDIWGGWEIVGGTANHYVQASWNTPSVAVPNYQPGRDNNYSSATWVGLGGGLYSNTGYAYPLIQAGTAQFVNSSGKTDYYFWFQVEPQYAYVGMRKIATSLIPLAASDNVGAVVYWVPVSRTAVFGLCNWSKNKCVSVIVPDVSEPGNTAEWILETPPYIDGSGNKTLQSLPSFSQINFYNACWAATTTLSVPDYVGPGGASGTFAPNGGQNGITSPVTCKSISSYPSQYKSSLLLSPPYVPSPRIIAKPSDLGSTGSSFSITYVKP